MNIVLGIPGKWSTRSDIVKDIAAKSNGLLFLGSTLMNIDSKEQYQVEIYDFDPNLAEAFEIAGRQSLDPTHIQNIQSHTFTLYVIGKGGSLEEARKVLDVGCGVLRGGGLALKIETTGKAHTPEQWFAFAENKNEAALYRACVALIGSNGKFYTCGMHNLGYRDAIVKENLLPKQAAQLLEPFSLYILTENPALKDGHTFSQTSDSPNYQLHAVSCDIYPSDDPFHNPFGMWNLVRVNSK